MGLGIWASGIERDTMGKIVLAQTARVSVGFVAIIVCFSRGIYNKKQSAQCGALDLSAALQSTSVPSGCFAGSRPTAAGAHEESDVGGGGEDLERRREESQAR